MAMKYSAKVLDHFKNPRNVGVLEDPDGVGEVGNPACGDIMTFYIKVDEEDRLSDIRFQTFGCGAAIAVSSMVSEVALGKSLDDASNLTNRDIANALDGLPKTKLHCSNLGADALKAAIKNYRDRAAGLDVEKEVIEPHDHDHDHDFDEVGTGEMRDGEPCKCPHCDITSDSNAPFCSACGAKMKC